MSRRRPGGQRGVVLMTVVVTIALLAVISLALSTQGVIDSRITSGELERDQLRYAAEAGLAHARHRLSQNATCMGYTDIAATPFASGSYSATISPTENSPVSVQATGVLPGGAVLTMTAASVAIYQPSTNGELQPGPEGIDTYIRDGANDDNNFGAATILKLNNASAEEATLIKFDLAGFNSRVSVESATLALYLEGGDGLTNGVIDVHRATRAWVEGDEDGQPPAAGEGATYVSSDGEHAWAREGGDYASPPLDSRTIPSLVAGWYTWDVTAVVQDWTSGERANHGLLLRASGGDVDKIYFTSSDGTDGQQPRLSIAYACECGYTCGAPATPLQLLFVVGDPLSLQAEEQARIDLFESWNMNVTLVDDSTSQAGMNALADSQDVVYVSELIDHTALGDKLRASTIGVVNEEQYLFQEFGFSQTRTQKWRSELDIVDNSHYITAGYPLGLLSVMNGDQMNSMVVNPGPGLTTLGLLSASGPAWEPSLAIIEAGDPLYGGGSAPARRVKLPWGEIDIATLTDDGRSITRRAIEWAAHDVTVAPPTPLAHWKLDETIGSTAEDSVGSNEGTLVNGPTWSAGKIDGGLYFDGSNDYIDVNVMNPMTYDDVTISAWYRSAATALSGDQLIFDHNRNFADGVTFGPTTSAPGDRLRFGFASGGTGTFDPHYSTSDVVDQQWHHLVGVRGSGRIRIYVDGVEETNDVDANAGLTVSVDGSGPFVGDLPGYGMRVYGTLDDIRLYDRALSAAEVSELFADGGGSGVSGGGAEALGSGAGDGAATRGSCSYSDGFDTIAFNGSSGAVNWRATPWVEVGESDGAGRGDVQVREDSGGGKAGYSLQIQDNNNGGEGVARPVDLSGAAAATLTLRYRREGLDNSDDYIAVYASSSGLSGPWTELPGSRFEGPGDDANYLAFSGDLSGYLVADAAIRLLGSPSLGNNDRVFLDDIEVACTP